MQKIYDIAMVPKKPELADRFIFPFKQMNYLLNGGEFDRVTLITSSTDNGKSTIASQIICSVVEQGYKCCCFFGEDTAYESQERIFKQAMRKNGGSDLVYKPYIVNGVETNCGEFVLDDFSWWQAQQKFAGNLYLYNTNASAKVGEILDGFEEARTKYGCRVFLLDNCDQFEFDSDNENKEMRETIIKIRDYAINKKVHIILIAHIRKMDREVILPNMFDVKGSSSLINIAKNVLIVVRMDKVDHSTTQYQSLKKLLELNNYNLDEADCLVHVAKTKGRKIGFTCLKYDKMTNTYYDCRKLDESKEEDFKVNVVAPKIEEVHDPILDVIFPV